MTNAERDALKWLSDHGGTGVFVQGGRVLLAGGEIAPFMRSTWKKLLESGHVLPTMGTKRITIA